MSDDDNVFEFTHYTDRLTPSDPPGPLEPLWEPPEGKSAREWCEEPDEENVEVLGPLVTEGSRVLVAGGAGDGKTTFVMQMAAAVANGSNFLGMKGCGGPVLIVDLEQSRKTLRRRLREADMRTTDKVMAYRAPDGIDLSNSEHRDWLVETIRQGIEEQPYRMLIIDPLYKAHSGDSSEAQAMIDLLKKIDRMRSEYNFALIVPIHTRKIDPLRKDITLHDLFGAAAFSWWPEVVLGLQKLPRDNPFDGRLFFLKDRDGDLYDLADADHWNLMFDRQAGFRRGADDLNVKVPSPQRILAYMTEAGAPVGKAAIRDATGLAKKTVDDWMPKMVAAGQVVEMPYRGPDNMKVYALPDDAMVIRMDGETTVHSLNADIESMGD